MCQMLLIIYFLTVVCPVNMVNITLKLDLKKSELNWNHRICPKQSRLDDLYGLCCTSWDLTLRIENMNSPFYKTTGFSKILLQAFHFCLRCYFNFIALLAFLLQYFDTRTCLCATFPLCAKLDINLLMWTKCQRIHWQEKQRHEKQKWWIKLFLFTCHQTWLHWLLTLRQI